MKEHSPYFPKGTECKKYTLFLDRDGVINAPIIDDYAKCPADFVFCEGALEALAILKQLFARVILVTNQQGIGRSVMSSEDLENVHLKMYNALKNKEVEYFNAAFYAPYLKSNNHKWRKPSNGMLLKANVYCTDIDWSKSIMVGDSPGDMQLADTLGLLKIRIKTRQFQFDNQDFIFDSLHAFVVALSN